ncbi:MAG: DUF1015 domain-containing protein [Phycisphaerales bacterium]
MIRIHPFAALRPPGSLAAEVSSDPYDVISTEEARQRAEGHPHSFLHVVRSEIDLPEGSNPYDDLVYETASRNLQSMVSAGDLVREQGPSLYVYRQVRDGRAQTGLVCCVDVEQYRSGEIRKHEKTRPDKEDDRTRHLLATSAHAEPVMLCFRSGSGGGGSIAERLLGDTATRPIFHFVAPDGTTHTGWRIEDPSPYVDAFGSLERIYIADGHHRSAGADRAAAAAAAANPGHRGDEEYGRFLAVIFPHDQMTILSYNRVVRDLGGLDAESFLEKLREVGSLEPSEAGVPEQAGAVRVHVAGRWWLLTFPPGSIDRADPIASLDVSLLQDRVLSPILGIGAPRTDPRIEFVGGIRGSGELERRSAAGGVAFLMHPTSPDELLAVADAGEIMPPKSTWFEPKLRSGLFVHEFERIPEAALA